MPACRNGLLSQHTHQVIVDAVRAGNTFAVAAQFAGVSSTTIRTWIKRGRAAKHRDNKYRLLVEDMEMALADCERFHVEVITEAAKKNPAYSQWLLERRFPDRWGKKTQIKADVTQKVSYSELVLKATEKRKKEGTTGNLIPFDKKK